MKISLNLHKEEHSPMILRLIKNNINFCQNAEKLGNFCGLSLVFLGT